MQNPRSNSPPAIAKMVDPMEKPPVRADMTVTDTSQEDSPLLPVVTEDSKVIEMNLIISSEHHTRKALIIVT